MLEDTILFCCAITCYNLIASCYYLQFEQHSHSNSLQSTSNITICLISRKLHSPVGIVPVKSLEYNVSHSEGGEGKRQIRMKPKLKVLVEQRLSYKTNKNKQENVPFLPILDNASNCVGIVPVKRFPDMKISSNSVTVPNSVGILPSN